MIDREAFRLTGGVLFSILFPVCDELDIQKNYDTKNSHNGPYTVVMSELLYVMSGERPKRNATERETFKTMTNRYRLCKIDKGAHLRIGRNDSITRAFDDEIKTNYYLPYKRMRAFVDGFILKSDTVRKSFIKAVLELIEIEAASITMPLYVNGPEAMSVSDVLCKKDFDLAAFILGVWHYCVTTVDNKSGQDTVDTICPSDGGNKRPYIGDLGCNNDSDIKFIDIQIEMDVDDESRTDEEPESIEAEIVDTVEVEEEHKEEQSGKDSPKPAPQMTFNFNVTGNNNSFYNHVDTVNNYYGGKKDGE